MRRFEREVQGRPRFWEIDQEGRELHVTTGEIGRPAKTRTRRMASAEEAASELNLAVRTMVDSGWTEIQLSLPERPTSEANAAVLAAPDDPAGYLVLGDDLQAKGDPRGELIAVQAARARAPEDPELKQHEHALLVTEGDALLGPLIRLQWPWHVEWFCGYIRKLSLHAEDFGGEAATVIEALTQTGSLDYLRTLRIGGAPQFDAITHALERHAWPVLVDLELGGPDDEGELYQSVQRLLQLAPRLKRLALTVFDIQAGPLEHPTLEELVLTARVGEGLGRLALTGLPALRRVTLTVNGEWRSNRRALVEALDVPLDRVQLAGTAPTEFLEAFKKRTAPLGRLVLGPTPSGPLLVDLLALGQKALTGIPVELAGVDVSDDDLARLPSLAIETDLPDVAVKRDRLYVSPRQEQVRRFERDGRFWSIVRDGATLRVRYGKNNGKATERDKAYPTAEKAAAQYRKRVRQKLAESWVETPMT